MLLNNRKADKNVVELSRLRYKKQEAIAGGHGFRFQVFIQHDKDAGGTRIASRAQIRPIGHCPVR